MLNNVQNNQPAFTSAIRMTQKTAKALHEQPQKIQRAIMNEIRALSNNGREDIVNISFKELVRRDIKPMYFHIFDEKVLKVDVLERRGADYFKSSATKVVT